MWKVQQSKFCNVVMNFTTSGNHNSSFTRAAIQTLRSGNDNSSSSTVEDEEDKDNEVDEYGIEERGKRILFPQIAFL